MIESNKSIENIFLKWLSSKITSNKLSDYYLALVEINDFCFKTKILKKPLFETTDFEMIKKVKNTVDSNKFFRYKNKKNLLNMTKAMQYYYIFIKENQSICPAINDELQKNMTYENLSEENIRQEDINNNVSNDDKDYNLSNIDNDKYKVEDISNNKNNSIIEKIESKDKSKVVGFTTPFSYAMYKNDKVYEKKEKCVYKEFDERLIAFKEVLKENFSTGFRMNSRIDTKRFKRFYSEKFDREIEGKDDEINSCVNEIGIEYKGKIFIPEAMLCEEKRKHLLDYIEKEFKSGKKAIYYKALFDHFSSEFHGEYIYNSPMLKTYLMESRSEYYFYRSYFTNQRDIEIDSTEEIRQCLIEYGEPMDVYKLYSKYPHIPEKKIKSILISNKEFIYNATNEYTHVDTLALGDDELDDISNIIQAEIDEKRYLTGNELYELLKLKKSKLLERLSPFSMNAVRDAIGYKLQGRYSFNANVISSTEEKLSVNDVYANYSKNYEHFTIDDLKTLKKELNSVIYFETVYANSLRISQEEFVSKEQAQFDIENIDEAIDRFCVGDYISIEEVNQFGSFPYAYFEWNSFLLEYFVYRYSNTYKLLHKSFNESSCAGAIVKRKSGFDEFNDVLVDVLVKSNISLNRTEALQYLCDKGYIASKTHNGIEQIIAKAKMQRNKKG